MQIVIDVDKKVEGIDDIPSVHSVPVKISTTEKTANITSYFYDTIHQLDDNSEECKLCATLRGRPLNGRRVKLPENCIGVVLDASDETQWTTLETFSEIAQWSLDSQPEEQQHGVQGTVDWLEISQAVHSQIDPSDVDKLVQAKPDEEI